jgi:hypothetical protein
VRCSSSRAAEAGACGVQLQVPLGAGVIANIYSLSSSHNRLKGFSKETLQSKSL